MSVGDLVRTGQRRDMTVLVESAQLLQKELPIRMAHRVKDMQRLPFIVGCNPYVKQVYELYVDSFKQLIAIPPVQTLKDEEQFSAILRRLVDEHTDVIPKLSKGMLECKKHISAETTKIFLDEKIRARIGIRVLAEQHLALHTDIRENPRPGYVGIFHQSLRPADIVRSIGSNAQALCEVNYGTRPQLVIDGHIDATFAFIPVHLEYIVFELLKNSFRATAEKAARNNINNTNVDPVEVTISKGPSDINIRFRDRGGGVPYEHLKDIWTYAYTSVPSNGDDANHNVLAVHSQVSMQVTQKKKKKQTFKFIKK